MAFVKEYGRSSKLKGQDLLSALPIVSLVADYDIALGFDSNQIGIAVLSFGAFVDNPLPGLVGYFAAYLA